VLAFFISLSVFVRTDSMVGLSVGSLFAVIGNKYIIDSSLPSLLHSL
jgi:hypothetical protein